MCIGLNPSPYYAYKNNNYKDVKLGAKFYIDEDKNQTIIKIPGDISKMHKVSLNLVSDPDIVYREKMMNFKKMREGPQRPI